MHSGITPGADILASNGEKLGTVSYVVVDPHSLHITDIICSTGAVIGRDIVVAEDQIAQVTPEGIHLKLDRTELDACPDYVDVEYTTPPDTWLPSPGLTYPTGAMLWPVGITTPAADTVTVNTPEGTVGLHVGMDVVSADGHKVGSIDSLTSDPQTDDITGFVVKHGFIFTHDTEIPADQVDTIENDQVKLKISRDQAEQEFKATS